MTSVNWFTSGVASRPKIQRVKRRLRYDELTHSAVQELSFAIERIVKDREKDFVDFYNRAIPITPKLHMLHLLPGIGKKLMWEIIEEREKKQFDSFADISQRIKTIPHPDRMIVKRILVRILRIRTSNFISVSRDESPGDPLRRCA